MFAIAAKPLLCKDHVVQRRDGPVNVGAHLVDVSPLSTLGALCIANAAVSEDRKVLFNKLMIWGLSMSVIGALVCWVFFGLL